MHCILRGSRPNVLRSASPERTRGSAASSLHLHAAMVRQRARGPGFPDTRHSTANGMIPVFFRNAPLFSMPLGPAHTERHPRDARMTPGASTPRDKPSARAHKSHKSSSRVAGGHATIPSNGTLATARGHCTMGAWEQQWSRTSTPRWFMVLELITAGEARPPDREVREAGSSTPALPRRQCIPATGSWEGAQQHVNQDGSGGGCHWSAPSPPPRPPPPRAVLQEVPPLASCQPVARPGNHVSSSRREYFSVEGFI